MTTAAQHPRSGAVHVSVILGRMLSRREGLAKRLAQVQVEPAPFRPRYPRKAAELDSSAMRIVQRIIAEFLRHQKGGNRDEA